MNKLGINNNYKFNEFTIPYHGEKKTNNTANNTVAPILEKLQPLYIPKAAMPSKTAKVVPIINEGRLPAVAYPITPPINRSTEYAVVA